MIMKALIIILGLIFFSCEKGGDYEWLYIYKTKSDYSNKVSVELSPDKSKIVAAPGPHDVDTTSNWPQELANGYLLNGILGGSNTAFLSIDKKDYYEWPLYPGSDSLFKLIIDKDPFTELYYYSDEHNEFWNDDTGLDTAKMNRLIKDGQLEKYFERIK